MADTQKEPIQPGSDDASRQQKIEGILDQVRSDARLGNAGDTDQLLRERLADAGLSLDEGELARIRGTLESD
jgi:hypothetical protein